jgi:hypothetical protein
MFVDLFLRPELVCAVTCILLSESLHFANLLADSYFKDKL